MVRLGRKEDVVEEGLRRKDDGFGQVLAYCVAVGSLR